MNIFVLDKDPKIAAQYHCDKHVIKMITESCQMLSTWARLSEPNKNFDGIFYKSTYINHPCNKWLFESLANVKWLHNLLSNLINEYEFRFEKKDKFQSAKSICDSILLNVNSRRTSFKLCMPEIYKLYNEDTNTVEFNPIESYRNYYKQAKSHLLKYTKREKPYWL